MIQSDRRARDVVWRMLPVEARALATFIEENTPPGDAARAHAANLRAAADRLDPQPKPLVDALYPEQEDDDDAV